MKLRKLLVGTDLSHRSVPALSRAIQIARTHGASLTVLHVADENMPEAVRDRVVDAARTQIAATLTDLAGTDDIVSTVEIVVGNVHAQIVEAAERIDADLVVLGRHREESRDAASGGTTMHRVVRCCDRPVLVVTGTTNARETYHEVMVGVDFSASSRQALRAAVAFAPDAAFDVVHAYGVPFEGFLGGADTQAQVAADNEQSLARLVGEAMKPAGRTRTLLREGDVTQVLTIEAKDRGVQLLVIGTHGREGIARFILGSVAQDLLDHPPCDVLVVRAAVDQLAPAA